AGTSPEQTTASVSIPRTSRVVARRVRLAPSSACETTPTLASGGRLLSQRELDGLVPRHRSSFVEGSVGSRLAEPGTGWVEVALAPCLGERWGMGYTELLPFRVDGSLEAEGVLVASEAGGG